MAIALMMYILCVVSPVLRWNVPEKVIMNQSTNGSCTATGSPHPLIKVILPSRCEYRTELTVIDNYTTAVEFRISHVSRYCQDIYCYISNHRTPNFSKQLNITGNTWYFIIIALVKNRFFTEVPERINVSTTGDADNDCNSGNLPAESGAKCATMEAYVLLVTLALVLVSSV